jgi:hypothetical protein
MVPVRAAPALAATLKVVVPEPAPDAPVAIVIQSACEDAVQAQVVADAVTAIDPEPPAAATLCVVGEIENVHGAGAAAWVTVNVWPATVIVPLRAAPLFAATLNVVVPEPVPAAPLAIVIQSACEDAVHAQVLEEAVSAIDPEPPDAGTLCAAGEIEKVHAAGGAACVTV